YAQGRFTTFSASSGLSDDPILSLCEDALKNVWIGTQLGLHLWSGDRFEPFTEEAGFPAAPKPVLAMERNRAGSLWIATGQSICRLTNRKFTTFLHETVLDRGRLTRARTAAARLVWGGGRPVWCAAHQPAASWLTAKPMAWRPATCKPSKKR